MKSIAWLLLVVVGGAFVVLQYFPPSMAGSVRVGDRVLDVEVAVSRYDLHRGLMDRDSLGWNSGMLFVFGDVGRRCFWMRDTKIPLSVAFLDDQARVIAVADMEPDTDELHCADGVYGALEVNRGWFSVGDIGRGAKIALEG